MKRYTRLGVLLLLAVLFEIIGCSAAFALTEAPGGSVATMDELNAALGGVHEVGGNKITLQDDIYLKDGVKLDNLKEEVTIDTNGKDITAAKSVKDIILAWGTDLKLTGNGSYHTLNSRGHCVKGVFVGSAKADAVSRCTITVDDGEFDLDADKNKIVIETISGNDSAGKARLIINGGSFYGGNAVINTDYSDGEQGEGFTCGPVDIQINKGSMSAVELRAPTKSAGDHGETEEYGANTIVISGKKNSDVNIQDIRCFRTDLTIKCGTINHIAARDGSRVNISGGYITGKGIDVINGSKLTITGGAFFHDYEAGHDEKFILLKDSVLKKSKSWASSIKGVTIYEQGGGDVQKVYHGKRRLDTVCIEGKSALTVSDLKCVSDDNNKIVRSAFYLEGSKSFKPVLTLKGSKKKNIKTSKYPYAYIRNDKYSRVKLTKKSLLKTKNGKKYKSNQKLPMKIKGNITVISK